jgi:hypothetical protein
MSTKETYIQVTQRKNDIGEIYYSFDYCRKDSSLRMGCKWGKWKTIKGAQRAGTKLGYKLLTEEVYVYA